MVLKERLTASETEEVLRIREATKWFFWTDGVFRKSLHGFREGKIWDYYSDFDLIVQDPGACQNVVTLLGKEILGIARSYPIDALAFIEKADGGTVGAIALAGALAIYTGLPQIPIRLTREVGFAKVKISPTKDIPLSDRLAGMKLILVTDHITNGGEVIKAARAVEENGGKVTDIVSFTAYSEDYQGAKNRLQDLDINLHVIYQIPSDLTQDLIQYIKTEVGPVGAAPIL